MCTLKKCDSKSVDSDTKIFLTPKPLYPLLLCPNQAGNNFRKIKSLKTRSSVSIFLSNHIQNLDSYPNISDVTGLFEPQYWVENKFPF